MTAHRMLRLLEADSDRASVLSRFIADLSAEDEQLLTGLLADGLLADEPTADADREPASRHDPAWA